MDDWMVTLPKAVEWADYQQELDAVADGGSALNYRINGPLKDLEPGDRCFLIWRGQVRGWMAITGIVYHPDGFTCSTTGRRWPAGYYLQRSGPFHAVENGPAIRGFQGVRRYTGEAQEVSRG